MSMRNARRGTPLGRFPAGLGAFGVLLPLALAGCGSSDEEPKRGTEEVDVTFVVTGDRRTADVSFALKGAVTNLDSVALPLRKTIRMPENGDLSIRAENVSDNGPGTVTCTVVVGERVISQNSGFGSSGTANCSDVTPTDPTVPGAKIPAQGNGTLPGESRLTRTVRVKRYPGQGSPTAGRVSDADSRLSYMSFGGTWGNSRTVDPMLQGFTRKQSFESEAKWEALIASGLLKSELMADAGAKGQNRLRNLAGAMQDYRQRIGIGSSARGRDVASQPIVVSGRKGWVIVREVRFNEEKVQAKLDLMAVAVVDTGLPRPAFLFVDIPETHKRLWPDVNTVIGSLRVK
ncbi:hypothetical protein [Actinomadura oligospora]|uniref:hypothetical protein n=1 Tax=Actinomadura oligospora TaxID=111804 RepID=UPI000685D15A|nr:hypothetical protein [Actinomadura oligospora]